MPIPNTTVRTSHAIAIRCEGLTIGCIVTWNPAQTRTVTPTYELNPVTSGEIYENVPGNIAGTTITVNRYDLFNKKMEQAWGIGFDITMLSDQTQPLSIQEKWTNPDGSTELWVYSGCWFTSLGRTISATGDRIINVSANLMYQKKRKFI